jgi:hypothetical protein
MKNALTKAGLSLGALGFFLTAVLMFQAVWQLTLAELVVLAIGILFLYIGNVLMTAAVRA